MQLSVNHLRFFFYQFELHLNTSKFYVIIISNSKSIMDQNDNARYLYPKQ